jgi:hypothetical protein
LSYTAYDVAKGSARDMMEDALSNGLAVSEQRPGRDRERRIWPEGAEIPGRSSMSVCRFVTRFRECCLIATAVVLLAPGVLSAEERLVFEPPRDANIRMGNGSLVKGRIKSIWPGSLVYLLKDQIEHEVPLSAIRVISTNDRSFQYAPAQEPFEKLAGRTRLPQGVTLQDDEGPTTGQSGSSDGAGAGGGASGGPNYPPRVYASMVGLKTESPPQELGESGGFLTSNGFGGASSRPMPPARIDTRQIASLLNSAESTAASPPVKTSPPLRTQGGPPVLPSAAASRPGETIICSNPDCRKEVPGARYGQSCPFCGTLWLAESAAETLAANTPPAAGGQVVSGNPFGVTPQTPPSNVTPVTAGTTPGGSTVVTGTGFSIESVPWWGKIGAFAGLMFVLWFVSQRR